MEDLSRVRRTAFPIERLFRDRRSPRPMPDEALAHEERVPPFDAARWVPSSFTNQPRRSAYPDRDTPCWAEFLELLGEFNRGRAPIASALFAVMNNEVFEGSRASITHGLGTGAARENPALDGARRGLVNHGIEEGGYERVHRLAGFSEGYQAAAAAIGRGARKQHLDANQAREVSSDCKPVFEGLFRRG